MQTEKSFFFCRSPSSDVYVDTNLLTLPSCGYEFAFVEREREWTCPQSCRVPSMLLALFGSEAPPHPVLTAQATGRLPGLGLETYRWISRERV